MLLIIMEIKNELDIYDKTFVDEQGNNISGYNDNLFAYMVFAGDNSIAKGDYNMMDKSGLQVSLLMP